MVSGKLLNEGDNWASAEGNAFLNFIQCVCFFLSLFIYLLLIGSITYTGVFKAVPSYIFVSRKLDLEKPTRQSGKKNEAMKKKRTVKSYRKTYIIKFNLLSTTKLVCFFTLFCGNEVIISSEMEIKDSKKKKKIFFFSENLA